MASKTAGGLEMTRIVHRVLAGGDTAAIEREIRREMIAEVHAELDASELMFLTDALIWQAAADLGPVGAAAVADHLRQTLKAAKVRATEVAKELGVA